MNIVKMIDQLEMVGFLKTNGTQCRFVGLTSKTPVVKIKAKNPWGAGAKSKNGLYKLSKKIGIINANYNTSVKNRLAEQLGVSFSDVEYENGTTWYEHLKTTDGKSLPLCQHKDETKRNSFYFQYFPHKSKSVYVNEKNEVIDDSIVEPYLYAEQERPDFKPSVIVVSLQNIMELKASGVIIQMPEMEEVESLLS